MKPIINRGVICVNSNPEGCEAQVLKSINQVRASKPIPQPPKNALVIGGSSGLGLASRISLAFGGHANTINVSYEKEPSEKNPTGTAGYHNNKAFQKFALEEDLLAYDINGDAFSEDIRNRTIDLIKKTVGTIDCLVFSLASGVRPNADGSGLIYSSLKAVGKPFTGHIVLMEPPALMPQTLDVATDLEIQDTIAVMGGSPWKEWFMALFEAGVLAKGFKTVAYSYIGSEVTHPVYFEGSLGAAKKDLHKTADKLNTMLSQMDGSAYIAVCPAITTKASVYIPGLSSYIIALIKLLKERGEYHNCQWHLHRVMQEFLFNSGETPVDSERLIRVDDIEMDPVVQKAVKKAMKVITPENFSSAEVGDFNQYRKEFFSLNGFT